MSKGATLQRAEPRLLPYHVATVPRVATQGVTCCNHTNVLRNTVQRGAASAAVPPDGMLLALRLCGNTVRCERHAPSCFARSGVFLLDRSHELSSHSTRRSSRTPSRPAFISTCWTDCSCLREAPTSSVRVQCLPVGCTTHCRLEAVAPRVRACSPL